MSEQAFHPDRSFPRLHPRPASGWLNDPNGIHRAAGRWHVFFQYNPTSARHHQIVWGHHSSADLLSWTEHPIAIRPQPGGPDSHGCFTGVATLDAGIPTLVYSGVTANHNRSSVVIARMGADEDTWIQDGHVAAGMPENPAVVAMRDPFLFDLGGRRWAVQAAGLDDGTAALLLHDATDLDSWVDCGILLRGDHPVAAALPPANIWECPQLVQVGNLWVAIVSLWLEERLTGVGYFVGDLAIDEESGLPRFSPDSGGVLDVGSCYYAPQAVVDAERDRVLVWGWAREEAGAAVKGRTQADNDSFGWSGSLTFPQELTVLDGRALLRPARELDELRGRACDPALLPDQAEVLLGGVGEARLVLSDEGSREVIWTGRLTGGQTRILLDASVIEVYPEGETSSTWRAYPTGDQRYSVEADAAVTVSAWQLGLPS